MKRGLFFLFLFLLFAFNSYAQQKLLDYFVNKKGDTIYGMIRESPMSLRISSSKGSTDFYLIEENNDSNKKKQYISHNLKKVSCFKYRGKLFHFEKTNYDDGIYTEDKIDTTFFVQKKHNHFVWKKPRLSDYLVTNTQDTIFGEINNPFLGKPFMEFQGRKIKIDKNEITAYRYKNEIFRLKQKPKVEIFDKKEDFIRVLIDDKIKLYDDVLKSNIQSGSFLNNSNDKREFLSNKFFFIEKNAEMIYINPIKFSIKAREVFFDCPEIMEKLTKSYFVYEDLYSMVILYNYYQKQK